MNFGTTEKTLPSKAEVYPIINNIVMSKWQDLWDFNMKNTGKAYRHIQSTVKKTATQYSSIEKHDIVYTRLRLGHNRLKANPKVDVTCRKCGSLYPETTHHVFLECDMNAEALRNLESSMKGFGYKTESLKELLSPPPKHTNSVVQVVMTFLEDIDYLSIL